MSEAEGTKKRGRPAKFAGDRTRGALTVRLRDEVRNDLELAATKNGRSLSEEIETRMELSLAGTQQIRSDWGEDVFRIAGALAGSLSHIEYWKGEGWLNSEETQRLFQLTAAEIVRNYADQVARKRREVPHGDWETKTPEELAQIFAALGGMPPPRPKRPPVELLVTDED